MYSKESDIIKETVVTVRLKHTLIHVVTVIFWKAIRQSTSQS
jgi:hypothetical protein